MDLDPMEYASAEEESKAHAREESTAHLNTLVAITVALLATFMALGKVKDKAIVEGMQQAQADRIDQWGYYQAHNIRAELYKATSDQMRLQGAAATAGSGGARLKQADAYKALADDQSRKKDKVRADAEGAEKRYEALHVHDEQFDLSEASLSLAIALLALTSLTQKRWLYAIALVPTVFGVLMGLAGLTSAPLHPAVLIRLLS